MDLTIAQQLFRNTDLQQFKLDNRYKEAIRYYDNENDIVKRGQNNQESKIDEDGNDKDGALRKANSHVSNNFHQIIVDQKKSYFAGQAPTIDTEDDSLNQKVDDLLGQDFGSVLQDLAVDASNAGIGWLHFWLDENNKFQYAVIPPNQIVPIYDEGNLGSKLKAVRRVYRSLDTDNGNWYTINEYWTETQGEMFRQMDGDNAVLELFDCMPMVDTNLNQIVGMTNVVEHDFGVVPFIPFANNKRQTNDLKKYKGLIDVYDDIYNGFVNDIKDVQQVILILENYGGTDLNEFMTALKQDKAVKMDSEDGDKTGLTQLQIEIPTQARQALMDETRKNIYRQGQAVDLAPSEVSLGNNTGVALQMLFSDLELKAQAIQTEFTKGVRTLVQMILKTMNVSDWDTRQIKQTWTRSGINDDAQTATMISQLAPVTSNEAIAKKNPLVPNGEWQEEVANRQKDNEVGGDSYDLSADDGE